MDFAAVDGLVAVAAHDCQRTSGCQSARLLPPERRPSLHDAAGDGDGRFRQPAYRPFVSVPTLEAICESRRGCCYRRSSHAALSTRDRGRFRCRYRTVSLRPFWAVTLCTRTSNRAPLHPCLPSLVVSRTSIDLEHKPARASHWTPYSRPALALATLYKCICGLSPMTRPICRKMTEREACRRSFYWPLSWQFLF